jgi:hypothetical protein
MYAAGWRAEGGIASMTIEIHEQTLWLIPVSLAVGFMFWVLLNWWREEHHIKESRIQDSRIDDRHIEDRRTEAWRPRVINLPAEPAPSSEARDWHRRGKLILH